MESKSKKIAVDGRTTNENENVALSVCLSCLSYAYVRKQKQGNFPDSKMKYNTKTVIVHLQASLWWNGERPQGENHLVSQDFKRQAPMCLYLHHEACYNQG